MALPRTQDAGKIQDQMLKHNQHFQESLAQSQLKQEELKRKKVQEFEDVRRTGFKKDEQSRNDTARKEHKQCQLDIQSIDHPYLGTKFDFSG